MHRDIGYIARRKAHIARAAGAQKNLLRFYYDFARFCYIKLTFFNICEEIIKKSQKTLKNLFTNDDNSVIIYLKRFRDWPPPSFERGKYL